MIHRMAAAALALVGLLVAAYLWLWKIGVVGTLACGTGGCEVVQTSEYAVLFGIPVAAYGAAGYLGILLLSLVGIQPAFENNRRISVIMVGVSGAGVAFTAYLTYLEAAVIHAWCRWCLVSAAIITLIFLISAADLTRVARTSA